MLSLRRRIEAPIGGAELHISDRVVNLGPDPTPLAVMYHFNLAHPAISPTSRLILDDAVLIDGMKMPDPSGPCVATAHKTAPDSCVHSYKSFRLVPNFATEPKTQPLSLFQNITRDHPPGGNDVRTVPAVASECRRSAARAWHRYQPRDGSILVEQVWSDVRRRNSQKARPAVAGTFKLAVAPGRGFREDQRRDSLPLAGS